MGISTCRDNPLIQTQEYPDNSFREHFSSLANNRFQAVFGTPLIYSEFYQDGQLADVT